MAPAPMFARAMGLPARLALYGVICVALMVLDHRYDAMTTVRVGSASLIHPLQSALARPFEFLGEAGEFFATHGQLLREKRRLEIDRERLAALLQGYAALQSENAYLQGVLKLTPPAGSEPLAARITRVLPNPFVRKLVVDRGSADGVEAGRPVVDLTGLVGQVTEVYPNSSVITLLTSKEEAAPVQNQRNGLRLIVSGIGSDNLLEVRYLDMHADLKAGDLLTTSGIDGVYPAGIQVARVVSVEAPRQTPFARAVCQPIGHIGQHRYVLILKSKGGKP
ncbi:rod shape-determining protein MreC [Parasulfuritortus cantonensis]|uniref:Cell shape-determining protein MreC n=1 Tax=Parasulfuritortus cantonensis TaxID=2528202 RepID=A0A4R1B3X6_9PROT|nr:rod shape-determining protein MreC [Parasulfuritortus cantonensis]TCJ12782.1 rod shape-determining protein MreC [Parasulfuritortus cantonensis]